jgi:hypothetical protein
MPLPTYSFLGQPEQQDPKMNETSSDYRLHDHHLVLKPAFQGVGRHPKTGKKKGGIKVHTVIHANEGVPSDIKFTSAAINDSFMLKSATLGKGDIMAMDRAYIDYEKFEQLTQYGVTYVTKMKKT